MQPLAPILTVHLFPELLAELLALLQSLTPEEWAKPTACVGWSVKDVAQHLLGDEVGKLSGGRDRHRGAWKETNSWAELVAVINENNAIWVRATRRMSPQLLCDMLAMTGQEVCTYFATLDPQALGVPVSWAGPAAAPVWLDLAREYTERWHHQQHIRDAVDKPGLKDPHYFAPVIDTFMHALPYTFRAVDAATGTVIEVAVTGAAGGHWFLHYGAQWQLYRSVDQAPRAKVTIDQETLWRLFTRGLTPSAAVPAVVIQGDHLLGLQVLEAVSIIA